MKMVTDQQGTVISGVFEIYTSLNAVGTFNFYSTKDVNSAVVFGAGASAGTIQTAGSGIDPAETGPVLITVNLTTNTYTILPITKWSIVGSTIPGAWTGDVPLVYQGNGIWSNTVALTTLAATGDTPRFNFRANGSWSYVMKKVTGTTNTVRMESQATTYGIVVGDIPMNYGTFVITLDLRNYTYSVACTAIDPMKISVMGSSVANGYGATNQQGYAYKYSQLLAQRFAGGKGQNWTYSNICVNGNSTVDVLNRWDNDLLNDCSSYVIYGLSLGNEGIIGGGQAIFDQFKNNLLLLISKARAAGKIPVVMNNYTRNDYTATEYAYIKQIDMLIHEWDVPSVNMLGAVDNGTGQYTTGYFYDALHPNDLGHAEISYAMVPSLFDALQAGKIQPIKKSGTYITMGKSGSPDKLVFTPDNTIHPFTVSFDIKITTTGTIASFNQGSAYGLININASTGFISYTSPNGGTITGNVSVNDGQWHKITLSHFYARGETVLYSDNNLAGSISEKITAEKFYLNDQNAPDVVYYKDWLFYRSGMNATEIAALNNDKMLKSSLELYAPLDGQATIGTDPLINLAQSTNAIQRNQLSTGIKNSLQLSDVSLYPNPASEKLKIHGLSNSVAYEYSIYSVDGRVVSNQQMKSPTEIEISNLSPAFYILTIKDTKSSDKITLSFSKK
jgi:lysophospholipase L1-like esterase